MPRGRLQIKGQLFDTLKKSLKQLERFMIQWNQSLSLVILCSDKEEGFQPREIWGIEYNKTLWECLLLMAVNNDKAKKEEKAIYFEYIICHNLPILEIPKYSLELIYDHMISFNTKESYCEKQTLDDFSSAKSQINTITNTQTINGVSIE